MQIEDLWLETMMVMLRMEGVYSPRLSCASCEVNVIHLAYTAFPDLEKHRLMWLIRRCVFLFLYLACMHVHTVGQKVWVKFLAPRPQPTTLLRLLRQTNVMHDFFSLWKLGHKVISTPGQKWLLMHLNENKQEIVCENKITPSFGGDGVYYIIRVCAQQNGQRATKLVSAGNL